VLVLNDRGEGLEVHVMFGFVLPLPLHNILYVWCGVCVLCAHVCLHLCVCVFVRGGGGGGCAHMCAHMCEYVYLCVLACVHAHDDVSVAERLGGHDNAGGILLNAPMIL
jgi:hypothetical protein